MFRSSWGRIALLSTKHDRTRRTNTPPEPARDDERSTALRALAAALSQALTPVAPSASFRTELARDLAAVARQKASPQIILQRPRSHRRVILIGAAAVSSAVSVAGLIAYIWRHRSQQATGSAS